MKADDKVKYEGLEDKEQSKFTNFELLQKYVEVLEETLDEVVKILRANNLVRKEEIEAQYFNEDEVYKRLENE